MYWYRLLNSLGRNSVVGTTVKSIDKIPENIAADEKHSRLKKDKVYLPITVGENCILGAEVSQTADAADLGKAYGVFASEAKNLDNAYSPETVNTDGWSGTNSAWKLIFPTVTIILCFLHSYLKVRETCRRTKDTLELIKQKVWSAFHAETKQSFSQRLRRLREWTQSYDFKNVSTQNRILSMCSKKDNFMKAYDYPDCLRTSNMADRLMRFISESLVKRQYFHGKIESATLWVRSQALIYNFAPMCPRKHKTNEVGLICPAKRLNGFSYSDDWFENLIVSTSMNGYRR
jgi:hypothetical protein